MKKDFFKEYGFRILFVVVFLLAFIWMGTKQTLKSNSNDAADWLPPNYQQTRDHAWYLKIFPFESSVVVSWEGCEVGDDRIELFAQKLVPEQTIDNFSLGASTTALTAEFQLSDVPGELSELAGEPTNVSTQALVDATGAELPEKKAEEPEKVEERFFQSVLTGPRLIRLLSHAYERTERRPGRGQDQEEALDEDGLNPTERKIRERLKGTLIGPDGKSTALIVTLTEGKRNGKELQRVLNKIREISVECGLPDTTEVKTGSVASRMAKNFTGMIDEILHGRKVRMDGVILGGPPFDNVALDQEGQRTLFRLAGICAVVGITIAFICLRSFRLTMFVFWVAIISAGVSLAIVSLTGGTCDSILLSMPALVYIIGMSGSVHMINYYHDAIRENGLEGATERAVRHAFTPSFFAQLTTAIGLASLFVGRLVPITKFGFYSAIGVLFTLILIFLYLPALLHFYPSRKFAAKYGGKGIDTSKNIILIFWEHVGGFIIKYNYIVIICCVTMLGFFAYQLPKMKTSVKMMSFFTDDAEIIRNYTWLEEKLGPLVPMELIICFDNSKLYHNSFRTAERLELINKMNERLKAELSEDIGGTLSVALFAPDASELTAKGGAAHRAVSTVVGKAVDDNRAALRDYIAIEGNPSLKELHEFLAEAAEAKRVEFENKVAEFNAELANDENVSAKGLDYDAFVADIGNPHDDDEFLTPYYAKFQALRALELDKEKAERAAFVLLDNKDYFERQGVSDLQTLLASTRLDRSLRKIDPSDVELLHNGAVKWRVEQGVEVWRISIRVWALKKDIDYSVLIEDVKNVVEPMLAEASIALTTSIAMAQQEGSVTEASPFESEVVLAKIAEAKAYVDQKLPAETAKKKGKDAKTLMREFTLGDMSEAEQDALQHSMGDTHMEDWIYPAGFSAKYTGTVPLVYKTQHELIKGLGASLLTSFTLILIIFIFLMRNIPAGFVAMLPNIFPVIVVFGFMSWAGILVDVGTMMTASVALGVAVDNTMHYLTWFNVATGEGMEPKDAAFSAYERCATAMTQAALISGFGLFSFAFSTFIPTQRFGIMMLAILMTSLFGDLIFLPSLLSSKLFGRFFQKRRHGLRPDGQKS